MITYLYSANFIIELFVFILNFVKLRRWRSGNMGVLRRELLFHSPELFFQLSYQRPMLVLLEGVFACG